MTDSTNSSPDPPPNSGENVWVVLVFLACIIIPAVLTLLTVQDPGKLVFDPPNTNPTPDGYTVSLLLFLVPDIALIWWLMRHPNAGERMSAFWKTVLLVFSVGCALDFLLCYEWFYFPNSGATLGIRLPAFSWSEGFVWIPDFLPLEEFGFYSLGGFFMMALYAYGDVSWFRRYMHDGTESDRRIAHAKKTTKLFVLDFKWLWIGIFLWLAGIAYKNIFGTGGIPSYYCFLVLIGVFPPLVLMRAVGTMINWRAFSFMYLSLLLISLIWEATLGVPYGWWQYKHEPMLGIFIGAWGDLPLEAIIMWLIAAWAVTIMYEVFRIVEIRRAFR